jgi:hypothetical protein
MRASRLSDHAEEHRRQAEDQQVNDKPEDR